jgi:hypothetical protein
MVRSILGVMAGVIVGFVLVAISDASTMIVATPPPGLDYNDSAAMSAYSESLPLSAFLIMLVGHAVAAFAAGFVAAWIARRTAVIHGLIVGILLLTAAVANLASFYHPTWFWVAEILIYVPAACAGSLLAPRPRPVAKLVSA